MIKPTIGRVVWFWDENHGEGDQPKPAVVCLVHSDTCVNLAVFGAHGNSYGFVQAKLFQGEGERPEPPFAEWMPYQISQAKRE